jgi:2-amino-4-hydroxy-6-hydroxymethyldihydropteridine diphosphokinase
MQTEVVLGLGGNKGDREKFLFHAIEALNEHFQLLRVSRIYETDAWGGVAKGKFLNQLAIISTSLIPEEVLEVIQQIEKDLGRTREEPWGDRTIDIDILYYGNQIVQEKNLKIPHPYLASRRFVLVPLNEILPEKKHPSSGLTALEMLKACEDKSDVYPYRRP